MFGSLNVELYLETVNQIFVKDISCLIKREYLSMLIEPPKEVSYIEPKYTQAGHVTNKVVRTETCGNEDWIVEALYGIRRVTADEEMYPELNLIGPETHFLSIADIAELMNKRATIHLTKPIEVVRIENNISKYLNMINEYKRVDLHYAAPPKEDLDMLERLKNMIEPLVLPYLRNKDGDSPFARLLRMTTTIMTDTEVHAPVVSLNGANNTIDILGGLGKNKNPFSIRNFP